MWNAACLSRGGLHAEENNTPSDRRRFATFLEILCGTETLDRFARAVKLQALPRTLAGGVDSHSTCSSPVRTLDRFEEPWSPSVREEFHGWIGSHPLPLRDFASDRNELGFPSANHGHGIPRLRSRPVNPLTDFAPFAFLITSSNRTLAAIRFYERYRWGKLFF